MSLSILNDESWMGMSGASASRQNAVVPGWRNKA